MFSSYIIINSCPSASLDYIIEPWFLGPGAESPGGPEFNEWADSIKSKHETNFLSSVDDLPQAESKPRVALISGRTTDNPRLLTECIAKGCKCIYLEKPGAPTVKELQQMKDEADKAGIEVLMGYNKVIRGFIDVIIYGHFIIPYVSTTLHLPFSLECVQVCSQNT